MNSLCRLNLLTNYRLNYKFKFANKLEIRLNYKFKFALEIQL